MFAKVRITAEQAGDGALLLRSAGELGDYPVTVLHSVRAWAEADPDYPLIAERGTDGGWRTVGYGAAVAAADAIGQALIERGLGPAGPLLILSGNGVGRPLLLPVAAAVQRGGGAARRAPLKA
jgi:feruloyl-CoA synthase